jgi:choline dehydrogenase-like flavoprotein
MSAPINTFDFLIAGGGTAGCVLASRLSQAGHSVALFEAGPQEYSEQVMSPLAAPALHGSPLEYNYVTTTQTNLANRKISNFGGRLLSGSSAVNYGNWTRCHSADYDAWAELVGDKRWSYAHLLKYFRKVEHHHDPAADPEVHGFNGPMHTQSGIRYYPLRDPLKAALSESGLEHNADANGGSPFGFSLMSENWRDGKRQPAGLAYDLSKVTVFTDIFVKRITLKASTKTASGLELLDGRMFHASKEVLVCCGSIRTPQLLMLSGVGPAEHLAAFSIPLIEDLPVGHNLHDHISATLYWKLKHPEQDFAVGSPTFMKPGFEKGNPIEWIITSSITDTSKAAAKDKMSPKDPLIRERRGHLEVFVAYAPVAASEFFNYSLFGTHISTPVLGLLPTSRGTITLASTDPSADPVINPNYLDSEMDREALRTGIRLALRTMLNTPSGKTIIENETPPPGQPELTSSSSDEEIDQRVQMVGRSFFQNAGTAAMGTVVDTELRVKNILSLRVVDASIIPLPLAGHYQCKLASCLVILSQVYFIACANCL